MKLRTNKREIMNGYEKVIKIGYCHAQHLLRYEDPTAYTASNEGWGADIYQVHGVAIVTGYSAFGNVVPAYDTIRQYDREAEAICNEAALDWNVGKERANALLARFVAEVTD